jgi:hypothetical protein
METDHDEDYAGEHVLPGASFLVFRDAKGWYWEAGSGLPQDKPQGPFKTGLDAYRAALEMYEATFGEGRRR